MPQNIRVKEVLPSAGEKKPTVIIDDKGARLGGFQPGLQDLKAGDLISAELKIDGKYNNIVSFEVLEKASSAGVAAARPSSPAEIDSHFRIAALESAVALSAGRIQTVAVILDTADAFYDWLTRKPPFPGRAGSGGKPAAGKSSRVEAIEKKTQPSGHEADITQGPYIDADWLAESLKTLVSRYPDIWNEEAIMSYMDKTYKVGGTTILDKAAGLDQAKANHFVQRVQQAIDAKEVNKGQR